VQGDRKLSGGRSIALEKAAGQLVEVAASEGSALQRHAVEERETALTREHHDFRGEVAQSRLGAGAAIIRRVEEV